MILGSSILYLLKGDYIVGGVKVFCLGTSPEKKVEGF